MPGNRPLGLDRAAVAQAVLAACLGELRALKPGNVHVHAAGHVMSVKQFEASAAALAEVVARPGLGVGRRIWEAVRLTRDRVGCNTNLGIVLLTVPLAEAAIAAPRVDLRSSVEALLDGMTVDDADLAFKAIALANPAGLGQSKHNDVRAPAEISLRDAMAESADRDRIARQYDTAYQDIFDTGLPALQYALGRWGDHAWSAALVYLTFLTTFPDTHIMRKHGPARAELVCRMAREQLAALRAAENPGSCRDRLLMFDQNMKEQGLNPGTSADLTVATLLAARLLRGPQDTHLGDSE